MANRHLISTKPLLCRCRECHAIIFYALDQGMPVYADTEKLDTISELMAKLAGKFTFLYVPGVGLWLRDIYLVNRNGIVLKEHVHRSGFYELEQTKCPTEAKKKETDLSMPLF